MKTPTVSHLQIEYFVSLIEPWNMMEKYFVCLSFCTSPPFFPLIQGFTLFSGPCAIPVWLLSPIQRLNQNDRCIPLLRDLETEYESVLKTTLAISCSLFLLFIFFFFPPPDPLSKWVLLGRKTVLWSIRASEILAVDWSSVCLPSVIVVTTSVRLHSAAAASPQSLPGPSCTFSVKKNNLHLIY